MNNNLHFSSNSNEWATPKKLFDKLNTEFGPLTLDVCATKENRKCPSFYGLDVGLDGLTAPWWVNAIPGPRCFLNPPYSEPEKPCKKNCKKKGCVKRGHHTEVYIPGQIDWVKKAVEESAKGCTVVCLLPARTDTVIFHEYCMKHASKILFIKGRVTFNEDTQPNPAPFPSMIVVFEPDRKPIEIGSYEQA